ncbi:MAG: hypothetical protein SGILL_001804 [Bacillariaceae sp.]
MRSEQYAGRHKVKFGGNDGNTPGVTTPRPASKSKSAPPSTPSQASAIAKSLQESQSTFGSTSRDGSGNSLSYNESQNNASGVRLQGITVDDLEVGFLKSPAAKNLNLSGHNLQNSQQSLQSPAPPSPMEAKQRHEDKVETLVKSIKKTKKLIKRTCRDVWTERDEVVHLQRTNWSIRKTLLQTEAPKDSITSLNLKIENALRHEREVSTELEEYQDEKEAVDKECNLLAKSIEEFKDLLDALNTQVVPLFPVDDGDMYTAQEGTTAAAAVVQLMDEDDFDDSIHSTLS